MPAKSFRSNNYIFRPTTMCEAFAKLGVSEIVAVREPCLQEVFASGKRVVLEPPPPSRHR